MDERQSLLSQFSDREQPGRSGQRRCAASWRAHLLSVVIGSVVTLLIVHISYTPPPVPVVWNLHEQSFNNTSSTTRPQPHPLNTSYTPATCPLYYSQSQVSIISDAQDLFPVPNSACILHKSTGSCLPSFFIIGAYKAGTSFLSEALAMHDRVTVYPRRQFYDHDDWVTLENRFFTTDKKYLARPNVADDVLESLQTPAIYPAIREATHEQWEELAHPDQQETLSQWVRYSYMSRPVKFEHHSLTEFAPRGQSSDCFIAGAKTPGLMSMPVAASRLHNAMPHAKLVLLVREPISTIESIIRMTPSFACRHEDGPCSAKLAEEWLHEVLSVNFDLDRKCDDRVNIYGTRSPAVPLVYEEHEMRQALESTLEIKEGVNVTVCQASCLADGRPLEYRTTRFSRWMVQNTRYGVALQRYLSLFPREHVKVVIAEHMFKDAEGTMRDLHDFLGLPEPQKPVDLHVVKDRTTWCTDTCQVAKKPRSKYHFSRKFHLSERLRNLIIENIKDDMMLFRNTLSEMLGHEVQLPKAYDVYFQ